MAAPSVEAAALLEDEGWGAELSRIIASPAQLARETLAAARAAQAERATGRELLRRLHVVAAQVIFFRVRDASKNGGRRSGVIARTTKTAHLVIG